MEIDLEFASLGHALIPSRFLRLSRRISASALVAMPFG
ncbi:hypothetical protein AKJ09_10565 [Labilithrix luteola]|uniref:Uncharacterized protein n=1 Tax=Labilithrix luteola TaxID=1391654 RepID=A0A0K1QE16_9BACT|nr:hypothetical protein AKJ09_10565 [Labilithrix luteola]